MKISKLFHWLYALVMLLPIFAIGVTCGYAMFNKNAYQSYGGLNENTESNIVVNSIVDFDYTKTYYIGNSRLTETNTSGERSTGYFLLDNVEVIQNNTSYSNDVIEQFERIYFYISNNSINIYANFYIGSTAYSLNTNNTFLFKVNIRGITGGDTSITNLNWTLSHSNSLYYIDYFTYQQIDNVFYYACDKVMNQTMFSWAYDSFLATPIVYITSLFSIPSTHIVVELLSYWLAISIIWLVFDLVMYVPLLVHRWIDKGVLE